MKFEKKTNLLLVFDACFEISLLGDDNFFSYRRVALLRIMLVARPLCPDDAYAMYIDGCGRLSPLRTVTQKKGMNIFCT